MRDDSELVNAFKWFTSFPEYVLARFGTKKKKKKISKLWFKGRRIETKKKWVLMGLTLLKNFTLLDRL